MRLRARGLLPQELSEHHACGPVRGLREITGMLLYKDGDFLQVLERPEQAITQGLQTIESDPRHRGMI